MSRWSWEKRGQSMGRTSPGAYYALKCSCGGRITGSRTSQSQICYCAACGASLFVLPESVYPRPRGIPDEAAPAGMIEFRSADSRTKTAPVGELSAEVREPIGSKKDDEQVSRRERDAGHLATTDKRRIVKVQRERKRKSPMRVVFAGILLVIGLTIWGSWYSSRRHNAELSLTSSVRLAQQAVDDDDLHEAALRFREVRRALDILGRRDAESLKLRRTALEIEAVADLAGKSLFEMLEEAIATQSRTSRGMWADVFSTSYRGAWVIFDVQITRVEDPQSVRRFEIDFPLRTANEKVVIVGDLACFDQIVLGGSPRRVIFAAQLEDFLEKEAADGPTWQIALNAKSAFLWSSPETLALSGIEIDDESRPILAEQEAHWGGG